MVECLTELPDVLLINKYHHCCDALKEAVQPENFKDVSVDYDGDWYYTIKELYKRVSKLQNEIDRRHKKATIVS